MKWTITRTIITATQPGVTGRMRYKVNPRKRPGEIDLTSLDGKRQGQPLAGIYELKHGQLSICFPSSEPGKRGARPKALSDAAREGSGCSLIILQKVKE